MEYCDYTFQSALGKRNSFDMDMCGGGENEGDNSTRVRLKGRRVSPTDCNNSNNGSSEVFAIYSNNNNPEPVMVPMEAVGDRRVISLTWAQFQALDKKLCSGMCVRIVA
jgi:hypothetical protein